MSRYSLASHKYPDIVVGWDPGLDTFFCQIWADTDEVEDRREVLWIGNTFQEVTTVEELFEMLLDYVEIPSEIRILLVHDQERTPYTKRPNLLAALAQNSRLH